MRERSAVVSTLVVTAALVVFAGHLGGFLLAWWRPLYDHATGSWFVIADDLVHGTLYRPLVSGLGIGGTRYLPLYPVLLAGLSRTGLDYVHAGLVINALAWIAAAAAAYRILRQLDVERGVAACFAVFAIGSFGTLMTVASIRGDLLPVALALWGVWAVMPDRVGPGRLTWGALLFTLAVSAKVSTIFWIGAVLGWLAVSGRIGRALRLAIATAVGLALFVAVVQWGSQGRFLDMMTATTGGGGSLRRWFSGPVALEGMIRHSDPLCYLGLAASFWVVLTRIRETRTRLVTWLLGCTVVMTAIILGSPGTIENHLIDVNVAVMLFLAVHRRELRAVEKPAAAALLLYALLIPGGFDNWYARDWDYGFRRQAVDYLRTIPGTVLSEHPGVPLAAGRRPYLADAFMVNALRSSRPQVAERLRSDVSHRMFAAILLTHVGAIDWYEHVHFGGDFLKVVRENYVPDRKFGPYTFFVPRTGGPAPADAAPDSTQ